MSTVVVPEWEKAVDAMMKSDKTLAYFVDESARKQVSFTALKTANEVRRGARFIGEGEGLDPQVDSVVVTSKGYKTSGEEKRQKVSTSEELIAFLYSVPWAKAVTIKANLSWSAPNAPSSAPPGASTTTDVGPWKNALIGAKARSAQTNWRLHLNNKKVCESGKIAYSDGRISYTPDEGYELSVPLPSKRSTSSFGYSALSEAYRRRARQNPFYERFASVAPFDFSKPYPLVVGEGFNRFGFEDDSDVSSADEDAKTVDIDVIPESTEGQEEMLRELATSPRYRVRRRRKGSRYGRRRKGKVVTPSRCTSNLIYL